MVWVTWYSQQGIKGPVTVGNLVMPPRDCMGFGSDFFFGPGLDSD